MILLKKKTPSQSCFCLLNPIYDISSSFITALLVYVAVRTMFITELSYKHHPPVLYMFITELINNDFNSGCKSNNGSKFNRGSNFNSGSKCNSGCNFSSGCNFNSSSIFNIGCNFNSDSNFRNGSNFNIDCNSMVVTIMDHCNAFEALCRYRSHVESFYYICKATTNHVDTEHKHMYSGDIGSFS